MQREPNFAGTDQPAGKTHTEAHHDAATLAIQLAHGGVDGVGVRGELGPVALAEYRGSQPQHTAEQAASLCYIERDHAKREDHDSDQCCLAHILRLAARRIHGEDCQPE